LQKTFKNRQNMSENSAAPEGPALIRLGPSDLPLSKPLEWPVVAEDGALLFEAGTVVPDEPARTFLFQQFELYRAAESANEIALREEAGENPPKLEQIGLAIGGRVGLRGTGTTGSAMYASRVIGFSNPRRNNERSLFITQPLMTGFGALDLTRGEQVEIIALTGRGVFRFACTVDAINREPFNYVVLSAPGAIRRLRTRKFARMPTRLAARFAAVDEAIGAGREVVWQLGRVSDISPYGMSLTVMTPAVKAGTRLRLAFHFNTDGVDVQIDTHAIVRHVGPPEPATGSAAYGLEFESLEPSQRIALKSFMAEHS
jgi:c-di-GMP-binding flagellar brake protein YcgR